MTIEGPFFTMAKAAEYCGYRKSSFQGLLRDYDIPRHGPRGTKFSRTILDAFMAAPETFLRGMGCYRRRTPGTVEV